MRSSFKQTGIIYGIQSTSGLNLIEGNRDLKDIEHIERIKEKMIDGAYISPITVEEDTLSIIDGQHRFAAACDLWKSGKTYTLDVIFIKSKNPLLSAIEYNNSQKKWVIGDYVNAYIIEGREPYKQLEQFCKNKRHFINRETFNYASAVELIVGRGAATKTIKSGLLEFTPKQLQKAELVYNELSLIADALGEDGYIALRRIILSAWLQVRDYVLTKMSLEKYLKLVNKKFKIPVNEKKQNWVTEYLRVAGN